ncbi:MAG: formylglycine-generating enzyme family protein [Gammaproteobacteria bacterium]|nr:formylglycine-generating enzyme family protein [Gammaproteobacteria bacterium]
MICRGLSLLLALVCAACVDVRPEATVGIAAPNTAERARSGGAASVAGMIFVSGGCYQIGDIFDEGEPDERPVHEVCVDDFYLAEHEVTQRQWTEIMRDNPSQFADCGDDCPVERVSWDDAQEYLRRLNRKTGRNYRLPTEAEWEYAARDRGRAMRWAGTNDESELGDFAWYVVNSGNTTHPVSTKKPNRLGLYDMTGNVNEWMWDRWGKWYYRVSLRDNPRGPATGNGRASRGGSWWSVARFARIGNRYADDPSYRAGNHGLRLALGALEAK